MGTIQNLTDVSSGLPEVKAPELPKAPVFKEYELPTAPTVTPVEKPSFSKYFETNLKPMLSNVMQEQLKQTQPLIQQFATQYQQDVKPLTDQLASSIYGRNVGATSGLGQEAYAKGIGEIMKPVTQYGLGLQGDIIGRTNQAMTNLATEGMQQDFNQQLNEYNLAQDRLYQSGQQTYEDTLAKKKYATDLYNQVEMSKFGIGADITKMGYSGSLQERTMQLSSQIAEKQAQAENARQQGNMTLANQLQKEVMGLQQQYTTANMQTQNALTQSNMQFQSLLNEKQAAADNARTQGNMELANKLQQDTLALQNSFTAKNMEIQDKLQKGMADYQNAINQGNMTLANQLQQQVMKVQNDYNIQNSVLANLLGKDMAEYQSSLQQGNLKYAAKLEQDAQDRKQLMDLALSGKMGSAGADVIAKQLGISPDIASALKTADRASILDNYWNQQMANNLPIDERVMNSLAVVNGGGPMTEEEKKKYLSPEQTILPPSNAYRTLIENADKDTLNAWGFNHLQKTRSIRGSLIGEQEAYWDMDTPENVKMFEELYKTNKDFRNWVATQI